MKPPGVVNIPQIDREGERVKKVNWCKFPDDGYLGNSAMGRYDWHGNCLSLRQYYPKLDLVSSVEKEILKGQSLLGSFFTLPSPLNHGVR